MLQHDLATPWVFAGSFAAVFGRRGFIGLDVEYLDFSTASFSLLENDRTPQNNQFIDGVNDGIRDSYRGVFRARIGGEFALGLARIRLGYRFQSSPYAIAVDGVTDIRQDISAGLGFRWKHFYLDMAYNHTLSDFEYSPYATSMNLQRVIGNNNTGQIMVTLGIVLFRDQSEQ